MPDTIHLDELNADTYYEDWLWGCKIENQSGIASNGDRVCAALALRIAADVLRSLDPINPIPHSWTHRDIMLSRSAIAGIRGQGGCLGPDADALGKGEEGLMLTEVCDIAVYG